MKWQAVPGTGVKLEWRWESPGVEAWVSTRHGGTSGVPFDTANLSTATGDDPAHVAENWRILSARHPKAPSQVVRVNQVHGSQVVFAEDVTGSVDADGLLTLASDRVLSILVADCVPIFLAAPERGMVGVLHAGWRGTVANIAGGAVARMREQGVAAEQIWAGIGPSIGPCCFQVETPVADALIQAVGMPGIVAAEEDGRHFRADLWQANRRLLQQAEVPVDHIAVAQACSFCHPDGFFSYRRDRGTTGRMGAFIWKAPS